MHHHRHQQLQKLVDSRDHTVKATTPFVSLKGRPFGFLLSIQLSIAALIAFSWGRQVGLRGD